MDAKRTYQLKCNTCDESEQVKIDPEHLRSWQNGELIQVAMPYLDAGQRELLISGLCSKCFDSIFSIPFQEEHTDEEDSNNNFLFMPGIHGWMQDFSSKQRRSGRVVALVILGRAGESVHITLECTLGGDLDVLVSPLPVKEEKDERRATSLV